jgi:restriction system protein
MEVIIGLVGIVVIAVLINRRAKRRAREAFLAKVKHVCLDHSDALGRRYRQLVKEDAYGRTEFGPWTEECTYFLRTQIAPVLTPSEMALLDGPEVAKIIWLVAANARDELADKATEADISKMPGHEYEQHCADLLRKGGWQAKVTKGSGDFGIDLIAQKVIDGRAQRIVLQCKRYSAPIGVAAVQEVMAGKEYDKADAAIVVSNQRYTPAAETMAATGGVLLLHHSDLQTLDRMLM